LACSPVLLDEMSGLETAMAFGAKNCWDGRVERLIFDWKARQNEVTKLWEGRG
jgi:hypothetical protein